MKRKRQTNEVPEVADHPRLAHRNTKGNFRRLIRELEQVEADRLPIELCTEVATGKPKRTAAHSILEHALPGGWVSGEEIIRVLENGVMRGDLTPDEAQRCLDLLRATPDQGRPYFGMSPEVGFRAWWRSVARSRKKRSSSSTAEQ